MDRLIKILKYIFVFVVLPIFFVVLSTTQTQSWGFFAHRKINRMAVFTLPPEMVGFFKKHIEYITDHSGDPDKRSRAVDGEAEKHYIDIDHYGEHPFDSVPVKWKDAVKKYTEDTLRAHGILPWNIETMTYRLTQAFKEEDLDMILYCTSNIGHYLGDANVPLHTTHFYNGKVPSQKGIHAFWESRLPELYADDFDFFIGRASYVGKPLIQAWKQVQNAHSFVDTVYNIYDRLEVSFPSDQKFSYESKGAVTAKVYSAEYSQIFSKLMDGMVEKQMRLAVKSVGNYWYTAWVNAGQPDLSRLDNKEITEKLKKEQKEIEEIWKSGKPDIGRPNPE